jgi:hypothetical protein
VLVAGAALFRDAPQSYAENIAALRKAAGTASGGRA